MNMARSSKCLTTSSAFGCGGRLLIISDACHSGAWVAEARRRRAAKVVVQASCGWWEKALDGVFISLWLLVQREEVSAFYALKHLESLERHPCIYAAPGECLPSLGPSWAPPVLLELESQEPPVAHLRRGSLQHFAQLHHRGVWRRCEERRRRHGVRGVHLERLLEAKGSRLLELLDETCALCASNLPLDELPHILHKLLESQLIEEHAEHAEQNVRASLCCLWNFAGAGRSLLPLIPFVPLLVAVPSRWPGLLEWAARLMWLLAEEATAREALRACDALAVLRNAPDAAARRWVDKATARLEQKGCV